MSHLLLGRLRGALACDPETMNDRSTLLDLLSTDRAGSQELRFFRAPGEYSVMTAAELRGRAELLAGALQRAGLGPGDELVMPIADPMAFLETFWAALTAGCVPMPLAPPTNDASCSKILDILGRRPKARLVLEDSGFERLGKEAGSGDALGRRLVLDKDGGPGQPVVPTADDIAFIQYSSGSTRAPKGVIIRHGQALANLEAIRAGSALTQDDRTLSWMPLSHDMGLVGFHLSPLYAGAHQAIMPTSAFARSPLVWIQDATKLGSTILSSPNFGYRHVLKALGRKGIPEGSDLSKVRLIMNGAEPISVEVADEFLDALAPAGLVRTAMFPVYGLAEATLAVTFPKIGATIGGLPFSRSKLGLGDAVEISEDGPALVTCGLGAPLPGLEVRIAGADGASLPGGHVGRVWIRGAGVTEGYFEDVAATSEAVQGEGWLDTGDLGLFQGGELYITGRLKDLVIVDGQNFYPHDLEESLQKALDIDALRVAVAPVRRPVRLQGGAEEIGVFVLHRGDVASFEETAKAVRRHLSETYGVGVELVIPVAQIPRTTSGKVQRVQLASALLAGDFDEALQVLNPERLVAEVAEAADEAGPSEVDASPEALEKMMTGFCDQVLGGLRFGPTDNLFEQGMSSIDLAEIHGLIEARYPKGLEIRDFFDQPTVRGLAEVLSERVLSGKTGSAVTGV